MITREANFQDLRKVFFPVEEQPISRDNFMGKEQYIPGYKAIVDIERNRTLSVVSDRYRLVHNHEAYQLADYVIKAVFNNKTIKDFECLNIYMPSSRASCRIDLVNNNNFNKLFGYNTESWTPFVRITNSYNKTSTLRFEIGFCRWICMNGVIFGEIGISLAVTHSGRISPKEIDKLIYRAKSKIGNIESVWTEFETKMEVLRSILLPESFALAIYCKVFNIIVDEENVTDSQKETLAIRAKQIIYTSDDYFREMGSNAYAMMNVLTDAASFPKWTNNRATFVNSYQRKVGKWVDNFIEENKKTGFNLSKYIGIDYLNAASYLRSLVEEQQ